MGGLFSALGASASTLDAYSQALNVTQNNVSNASTPGYASQSVVFNPLLFDPRSGPVGGVGFGGTSSLRSESAERYVQEQSSSLGSAQSLAQTLGALQPALSISAQTGISGALTQFFSSFSALSQNPNDMTARSQVIDQAQSVGASFQGAAAAVNQAGQSADQQISSTVSTINALAANIAKLNQSQMDHPVRDPNVDASLHADLETLSQYVSFSSSFSASGAVTVAIDGQTPLVVGSTVYALQSRQAPANPASVNPLGVPPRQILDGSGNDITAQVTGGKLGGLLQFRNTTVAGLRGDPTQQGSLNQLAQGFADRVNSLLTSGQVSPGPPPVSGSPLFQYSSTGATAIAASLSVTSITPQQIATISPGPPYSANGVAQQIGNLANSSAPADQIQGYSFTGYYGQIAGQFGQQLSDATTLQTQQSQAVAQAQSLRSQVSGVSLDQEAVQLTEFQKAYEATSKLVSVINSLTETTIGIIQ